MANIKHTPEEIARINALRAEKQLSYQKIAAEMGMTKGQVSGIILRQKALERKPRSKPKILAAGARRERPRNAKSEEHREPAARSVAQIIGAHLIKYKLYRRGFYVSQEREPLYIKLLIAGHSCVDAGRLAMRGKRPRSAA